MKLPKNKLPRKTGLDREYCTLSSVQWPISKSYRKVPP